MGPASSDRSFFGHPRGLSTLFFTEMWERFSYYGMRGFLILYMTASPDVGGLGLGTPLAAAIYGTYTSSVYLLGLLGGWLADRLLGQRRAVLYGGLLIASGHFSLAFPAMATFYLGLALIVIGTGLLKTNISVIVGQLYEPRDKRRDAGFSIFYMGINLGAMIGPIATGVLAQSPGFRAWLSGMGIAPNSAWHWAFGAAGVGMTLGVLQYVLGSRHLGTAGLNPTPAASPAAFERLKRQTTLWLGGAVAVFVGVAIALTTGVFTFGPAEVTGAYRYVLITIIVAFFWWLFGANRWTREERDRLIVITVFFAASALFWSVFEQAGSTLNLFADRSTRTEIVGYAFPSSWFQSVNAFFLVLFAPVFAWLWITLGNRQPSSPAKFSFGLMLAGLGFLVLVPPAQGAESGALASPLWLILTYLLHTWGELCLSPVGLSSMTKLAPARIVSLMMGVWFMGTSVGNYLGGQMAGLYEAMPLPSLFGAVGLFGFFAGVVMLLCSRALARMMHGAE
jgi:POT family proton-dependent oligopeptide transporter